jgi:hypothetical protein
VQLEGLVQQRTGLFPVLLSGALPLKGAQPCGFVHRRPDVM